MNHSFKREEQRAYLTIVEAAKRLYDEIGFEKTTIADIARSLRISSTSVYRVVPSRAAINESVGRQLMRESEIAVERIVLRSDSASEKLFAAMAAMSEVNAKRFESNRKLHELVKTAFDEKWPIVREHIQNLDEALTEIISEGNRQGEFHVKDCKVAAMLVRSASTRFWHPHLMIESTQESKPTINQVVDFCLAALAC